MRKRYTVGLIVGASVSCTEKQMVYYGDQNKRISKTTLLHYDSSVVFILLKLLCLVSYIVGINMNSLTHI